MEEEFPNSRSLPWFLQAKVAVIFNIQEEGNRIISPAELINCLLEKFSFKEISNTSKPSCLSDSYPKSCKDFQRGTEDILIIQVKKTVYSSFSLSGCKTLEATQEDRELCSLRIPKSENYFSSNLQKRVFQYWQEACLFKEQWNNRGCFWWVGNCLHWGFSPWNHLAWWEF